MAKAKPFSIPKREVWDAFQKVKANQGAAGVDGQSIAEFEADLTDNLYRLWNRMSSGSYFPPPVDGWTFPRAMDGPGRWAFPRSATGSPRRWSNAIWSRSWSRSSMTTPMGIAPADRRSMRSGKTRQRCWRFDWVLDIDVQSYFDSIDWELLLKAVRHHTDCPWVLLYIERWLKAPVQMQDGSIVPRTAGTPQGGVISPILANLFLHYVFDVWMARSFPAIPVRALRGRHHLPLPQRSGGSHAVECPGGPLSDLWAGSSSGKDEDRLLQGHEPARRLSGPVV